MRTAHESASGMAGFHFALKGLIPLVIPALLVLQASTLSAQQTDPQSPPASSNASPDEPKDFEFRRFFHDDYKIWTAPFHKSSYSSPAMMKYGVPFLLITGGLLATDRKTVDALSNTNDQVVWSGRVSQVGAVYTLAGISAGAYLLGKGIHNKHLSKTGVMGLEALAHAEILTFGLKLLAGRERPIENDHHGRFLKGRDSFPSGHATTSFALATVFAYEYRKHIIVPIAAYSAAALIAASRTSARKHWPSDVFVGGSIGFLIGRFVQHTHTNPASPGAVAKSSRLIPSLAYGGGAGSLSWYF